MAEPHLHAPVGVQYILFEIDQLENLACVRESGGHFGDEMETKWGLNGDEMGTKWGRNWDGMGINLPRVYQRWMVSDTDAYIDTHAHTHIHREGETAREGGGVACVYV